MSSQIVFTQGLLFEDVEERLPGVSHKDVGYADSDFIWVGILQDGEKVAELFYSVTSECWVYDQMWDVDICNHIGQAIQTCFVNLSSRQDRDKDYTIETLFSEIEESLVRYINKKDTKNA